MPKSINFSEKKYDHLLTMHSKLSTRYSQVTMRLVKRKYDLISGYFIVKGWIS